MEYRDLLVFSTVAKLQSFSAAAKVLHVAQSALSRRVQRLEQQVGTALLERHPRGVRPTPLGFWLLERAERVDEELKQLREELHTKAGSQPAEVRLAMPQGAARLFGSSVLARYQALCPAVRLHIVEKQSAENRERVLTGDAELALVYDAQPNQALEATPLLLERVLVISAAGSEPVGESYDAAELAALPLILPGLPHAYRRIVEAITHGRGLAPNVILEVNGFATSLAMVQQGLGVTISTYPPVQSAVEAGALTATPIVGERCEVELSLVHRRDRALSAAARSLKDVIQAVTGSIEPTSYWRPVV